MNWHRAIWAGLFVLLLAAPAEARRHHRVHHHQHHHHHRDVSYNNLRRVAVVSDTAELPPRQEELGTSASPERFLVTPFPVSRWYYPEGTQSLSVFDRNHSPLIGVAAIAVGLEIFIFGLAGWRITLAQQQARQPGVTGWLAFKNLVRSIPHRLKMFFLRRTKDVWWLR